MRNAATSEPRPIVPCAHDICTRPAILRRKLKTGWANLCERHDLMHVQQEADDFVRAAGFQSAEEKIAWAKDRIGAIGRSDLLNRTRIVRRWESIMSAPTAAMASMRCAKDALRNLNHGLRDREPGDDDE